MTRGNRYVLYQEVSLQYKKDAFYGENIHWNSLPRDVAESPRLEVFKMPLDML